MKKTVYRSLCSFILISCFSLQGLKANNSCYTICQLNQEKEWCPPSAQKSTFGAIQDKPLYQTGKLYVKIRPQYIKDYEEHALIEILNKTGYVKIISQYGITEFKRAFKRLPEMKAFYKLSFTSTDKALALIKDLQQLPAIEFAEQVPARYVFATPNDIHPQQYNTAITNAEQAWDLSTGNYNVVIGMVDDAVLTTHEDLAANIWVNTDEIDGNGIDDDNNGYIDDINGWNAVDDTPNPNPTGASDFDFSHGTHCSGIAAAVTDNGIGLASISWNVQLLGIRTAASGSSGLDAAMQGVEYAIANDVDVISMSWGGGAPAATEQAIFDVARSKDIILVAAAGNDNTSNLMYPASYEYVIAVAASDNADLRADFSNYGDSIDVVAPGVQIYSSVATTNSSYINYDGTSMACPYVSGLAALMRSLDPSVSAARVEECLENTADDIYAINPDYIGQLGAGRVNAYQALVCTPSTPTALFEVENTPPCAGEPVTLIDVSGGTDNNEWLWEIPGLTPETYSDQNPTVIFPSYGSYQVTLTVTNDLGSDQITQTVVVAEPTASLSGTTTILQNFSALLPITFTGTPPYSITYTDGNNNFTETGITDNPYQLEVSPLFTTIYTLTDMSNAYCSGLANGNAVVSVIIPNEDNDVCSGAGPFPPLNIGVTSCLEGDNSTANAELPYINQNNCSGVDYPDPAADLWYSFEAVANILQVDLSFSMQDAVVGLYEGTCDGLVGRDCIVGSNGSLNTTFAPVSPGSTYYLQVSGGTPTDIGTFELCLENYGETIDEICILEQTLNVSPTPSFGAYTPGQAVTFCLNIAGYNLNASDWLHGIVPVFGQAWDVSTITNITPSVTGSIEGYWDWYNGVTSTSNPGTGPQGPGFFFETGDGSPFGQEDNDPGNNYGDQETPPNGWEFCFTISTVAACPPGINGDDLSIQFVNLSDSESGSWISAGICPNDPEYVFKAVLSCCPPPIMTGNNPNCSNATAGSVTATINTTAPSPPYTFEWSTGLTEVQNETSSISGLGEGFYIVTVTDNLGCTIVSSYTLEEDENGFPLSLSPDVQICKGESTQLTASGGNTYNWSPANSLNDPTSNTPLASPEITTTYLVVSEDNNGCLAYDTLRVEVLPAPPVNTGETISICAGESANLTANGVGTIFWEGNGTIDNPNAASTNVTPVESGYYVANLTDTNGCLGKDSVFVYIAPTPYFPDIAIDTTVCSDKPLEIQLSEEYPISNYQYQWSPTTGLDNPNMPNTIATVTQSTTYTITVTNQAGCQYVEDVEIEYLNEPLVINIGNDTTLCGSNYTISSNQQADTYLWQDGSTNATYTATTSGTYILKVQNEQGCAAYDTIELVLENPQTEITGTDHFTQGDSTSLTATDGRATYLWSTGDTTQTIYATESGIYSVSTTTENGCLSTSEIEVTMLFINNAVIPNAFSPNNDGINDYFNIITNNPITAIDLKIYDRWGKQVFKTNEIGESWDGLTSDKENYPIGTYAYSLHVTFIDEEQQFYSGSITLLR